MSSRNPDFNSLMKNSPHPGRRHSVRPLVLTEQSQTCRKVNITGIGKRLLRPHFPWLFHGIVKAAAFP